MDAHNQKITKLTWLQWVKNKMGVYDNPSYSQHSLSASYITNSNEVQDCANSDKLIENTKQQLTADSRLRLPASVSTKISYDKTKTVIGQLLHLPKNSYFETRNMKISNACDLCLTMSMDHARDFFCYEHVVGSKKTVRFYRGSF